MAEHKLMIGIVASPWTPVPPPAYGDIEVMVDSLARGLAARGHRVVLFTTGTSTCEVERAWVFDHCDPERTGESVVELRHAATAYDQLAACDIIHDHTLVGLLRAEATAGPSVVATNHEPYDHDVVDIYRRIASRIPVIAVSADQASRAPGDLDVAAVIHPGIDLDRYRLGAGSGDYLATLGKMRPSQGIDVAIEVARQAGLPLLIAARMRHQLERDYFTQVIEPQLGSGVEYLGEVDHDAKVQLLGGARALLNPVQQPEPFDLALVEAMACGTPVIATRTGSTPEIVTDSVNGFLATTNDQLVTAAKASRHLSRNDCHQQARLRFSMDTMAAEHESFYRSAILTHNAAAFGKHGRDGDRPPWND